MLAFCENSVEKTRSQKNILFLSTNTPHSHTDFSTGLGEKKEQISKWGEGQINLFTEKHSDYNNNIYKINKKK